MTTGVGGSILTGHVSVATTQNTGLTKEYWADRLVDRIVHVADDSDSIIKEQAMAFKDQVREAIILYMGKAIISDRTTLYNLFIKQGHNDMAEILRRLP